MYPVSGPRRPAPERAGSLITSSRNDNRKEAVHGVATGLRHAPGEDPHTTLEKLEELFGPDIAGLVDGLTKLSRMTFEKKADHEAENFRKMVLAMGRDIRVILIN